MRRVAGGRFVLLLATASLTALSAGCSLSGSAGGPPRGWKLATDPTGSCQVSTPPDWQLGREFFLKKEAAYIRETANGKQAYPPRGFALWDGNAAPGAAGEVKRFQLRHAKVQGQEVCSVWRVKEGTTFTADETALVDQIGQTLRWVK